MLPKHIKPENTPDHTYRLLALYICGHTENNPDEKMLASWFANCEGENLQENLMEIEAVQALNTRATGAKTYHLMVAFRPEDEDKLTMERLEAIDKKIALALGLEQHQRCCGIHKNTNNLHMHIGYNLINPDTFNICDPHRDYYKLAKVCREIEREYGLVVDPGLEEGKEPTRTNIAAQTMEAHSGQESFNGYVQRHKTALVDGLASAASWQDVHMVFAEYGVGIKPGAGRKGGLVLYDLHNKKYHIKASSLARATSGPAMEKRFGSWTASPKLNVQEVERYSKRPLQHEPNRGNLYDKYLMERAEKKRENAVYYRLKDAEHKRRSEIYEKWNQRKKEIQSNTKLTSRDRWALIQDVYLRRNDELASDEKLQGAVEAAEQKKQEIREKYPFSSWNDYLKKEALHGNETALAILRSKKIKVEQEAASLRHKTPATTKATSQNHKAILENANLATKDKKRLLAVSKLAEKSGTEIKTSISPSGVLIMALPSGGTVRDTGKKIYFSKFDVEAEEAARQYAKIRWGKMHKQQDNTYVFAKGKSISLER